MTNTLLVTLAHAYVTLALMVAEANHSLERLDIPGWKPITASDVVSRHIAPPRLMLGGSFETSTHFFGFGKDGRLQFITRFDPNFDLSILERYKKWAEMKSLIGTNEAYQLATNWLTRLEVDVPALEKAHPPHISQAFYNAAAEEEVSQPKAQHIVMLPRFEVKWGTNKARPVVRVSIFGPTKEPIHIRQENISFSKRPAPLIKNPERLLSITNQDFAHYSLLQKSNLVVESAVARYSNFSFPDVVRPRSTNALNRSAIPTFPDAKRSMGLRQDEIHTLPPASEPKSREPE